jgi:CRP-like cAMP-binding protein
MPAGDFFAFCTTLRPLELKAIGALSQVRHIPEHETIYVPGDVSDTLYIINRGLLEVVQETGRTTITGAGTYLSRGDVFGDLEALADLPRRHTVRTCEPASLQCFHRKDFPELVRRVPAFFRYLSESLAARLVRAHDAVPCQSNCLELSGNLANFDLVTVYQTIVNSSKTGELSIRNEGGELISAFFFESGRPKSGQFQHLTGEEAFCQLFLAGELRGTFSFTSGKPEVSSLVRSAAMKRGPDDLLIAALQSRDELTELRRDLPEAGVLLKRNLRELETSEISPPYLRHVAEEIWRRLFARPMSVTELHQYLSVSELKVYQAVRELLDSGHLAFADSMIAEKVA